METLPSKSSKDIDTIVLLRRPRPPKKASNLCSNQNSSNFSANISNNKDGRISLIAPAILENHKEKGEANRKRRQKEGDFVIHPLFPRGPNFFPPGNVLHASFIPSQLLDQALPDEIHLPCSCKDKDQFMLNTFLVPVKVRPPFKISPGSISRQNYLKLTSWFSHHVPKQERLNLTPLEVDLQAPPSRVPKQQALLGKSLRSG